MPAVDISSIPDNADPTMGCWICGRTELQSWKSCSVDRPLVPEDLQITDYRYGMTLALSRCRHCGFVFAAGGQVHQLEQLYEQLSDPGYLESQESRALQMRWLIDRVLHARPKVKTLLDIGAGAGVSWPRHGDAICWPRGSSPATRWLKALPS